MYVLYIPYYVYRIGRAGWKSTTQFFMTDKRVEVPKDDSLTYKQRRKAQIKAEKKRRQPSKKTLAANSPGGRGKPGRPKGDAAKINEYKARMLSSPKSKHVLNTIFDAALDNDHKNQAAAWKLVMDRILPVAAFEKDIVQNNGKSAIQINITGVGTTDVKDIDPISIQPSSESDGFNLKPKIIDGKADEIL